MDVKRDCWRGAPWYPLYAGWALSGPWNRLFTPPPPVCIGGDCSSAWWRHLLKVTQWQRRNSTWGPLTAVCNPSLPLLLRKILTLLSKQVPLSNSTGGVGQSPTLGMRPPRLSGVGACAAHSSYRISGQQSWGQAPGVSHPADQLGAL